MKTSAAMVPAGSVEGSVAADDPEERLVGVRSQPVLLQSRNIAQIICGSSGKEVYISPNNWP